MEDKISEFNKIIKNSKNIVFFGGAGVSTESGIPDFRSKDGLYNQKYKYPPEEILSHSFFMNNTEEFYKFYREKMNSLKYEPNITHIKLAELEKQGKLKAIRNADVMIVAGTSLTVYPASGLINFYKGNKLILINRDATKYDSRANLVINDSLGKVFENI